MKFGLIISAIFCLKSETKAFKESNRNRLGKPPWIQYAPSLGRLK